MVCSELPTGVQARLKVQWREDFYTPWSSALHTQTWTDWVETKDWPVYGWHTVELSTGESYDFYSAGIGPSVGDTCTAPVDTFRACWTATSDVVLTIKVTDKFIQNPTYEQLDRNGTVVDSGRFDDTSYIWVAAGHTLSMMGPWLEKNVIQIEAIRPF